MTSKMHGRVTNRGHFSDCFPQAWFQSYRSSNPPRHRKWWAHQALEVPENKWLLYAFPQLILKISPVHSALSVNTRMAGSLMRAWAIVDASARSRSFLFHPNAEASCRRKHSEVPVRSYCPRWGDRGLCSLTHTGVAHSPRWSPAPCCQGSRWEVFPAAFRRRHLKGWEWALRIPSQLSFPGCTPDRHWVPCGPCPRCPCTPSHRCRYLGNECTEMPPWSSWGTCQARYVWQQKQAVSLKGCWAFLIINERRQLLPGVRAAPEACWVVRRVVNTYKPLDTRGEEGEERKPVEAPVEDLQPTAPRGNLHPFCLMSISPKKLEILHFM